MTNRNRPKTISSTHRVSLPRGVTLAFEEYGTPGGAPVLFLGAAPSSRLLDPDPGATSDADVRLLTVDRPGYGASPPLAEGDTPSWSRFADDLAEGLTQIGVRRVAVVGWSNGGIAALALAARHPTRVSRVVVTGTPAPDDEVSWIPDAYKPMLDQLRLDPAQAVPSLAPMLAAPPEAAIAELGGGVDDERTLSDPDTRAAFEAMLVEAYRQGGTGVATDIVATNVAPWGFELAAVEAPVSLIYGASDAIVPRAHGEWYASQLQDAALEVVEDTGHLVPITHWRTVLDATRQ